MSNDNQQRASIKRITFDLVYPSGELKTVRMQIHEGSDWGKAGLIVFNEQLISDIVIPGLAQSRGQEAAKKADELWNSKAENEMNYPAMLIIESTGEAHSRCGGHHGELIHKPPVK